MPEHETFETIIKKYVDAGADVHTAVGKAIEDDPESYGDYLKRQTQVMADHGSNGEIQIKRQCEVGQVKERRAVFP
jgi:hypothetical protein